MDNRLKIGIVGCGAIGSSLAGLIQGALRSRARLAALYDIQAHKARGLALKYNKPRLAVSSLAGLVNRADLVIESSGAASASAIARSALAKGKDVLIMSVGGVIRTYPGLLALARHKKARIYIPSGALCGIDGLKAAACGKIRSVVLTTTKPPSGFAGNAYVKRRGVSLEGIRSERVIFEGSAMDAVKAFPQNINVAAVLSLAGVGPEKTVVRIIANPSAKRNSHEVRIESDSGVISARTENVIHPDNPKTSYLAVLSAAAMLRQIVEAAGIGT